MHVETPDTPTVTIVAAPSNPPVVPSRKPDKSGRVLTIIAAVVLGAIGSAVGNHFISGGKPEAAPPPVATASPTDSAVPEVKLTAEQCATAGVRTEPATNGRLTDRVWRSGIVQFNQDRIAHLACPVDGIVRDVRASQGQTVTANDVLAVVDSRQVGRAKLDLMTARIALASAETQDDWTKRTTTNATELWKLLAERRPITEIESALRSRPTGEWRDKLLTAYSRSIQLRGTAEDLTRSGGSVVPESTLRRAKAEAETANAQYDAVFEEARYQIDLQARSASQKLKEAKATADSARAELLMVGYTPAEIDALDPAAEGGAVSHFAIKAPFVGTVVSKHAVYGERVTAEHMLFELADLSKLWIKADLFEADLPLIQNLKGQTIRFRAPDAGITERDAALHYVGSAIDPASRSLPLIALADNADRTLKSGMFVEVGLPRSTTSSVLSVPASAIQRHEGRTFVFVQTEPDTFRRVDVACGRELANRVEITAGLKIGDVVATDGTFVLKTELLKEQIAGE